MLLLYILVIGCYFLTQNFTIAQIFGPLLQLVEQHSFERIPKYHRVDLEEPRDFPTDRYSYQYRKLLKHRILKKRKSLTEEALLICKLLDKLEAL